MRGKFRGEERTAAASASRPETTNNKKIRRIHLGMTTREKKRATRKIKTSITMTKKKMTEEKRAKKKTTRKMAIARAFRRQR